MNLGIGLGVTNYLRVPTVALDPDAAIAQLFRTGTPGVYYEGAWYDPSDSSTVFQDAAGTTPAGVGDPVGLILDKSKGLTLGTEQVTNGDFSSGTTGWTNFNTGVLAEVSGQGVLTTNAQFDGFYQTTTSTLGPKYKITFDVVAVSGGTFSFGTKPTIDGSGSPINTVSFTSTGSYSIITTTGGVKSIAFQQTVGTSGSLTVDNISIRELPGNHATQTTSAARPVLQIANGTPSSFGPELVGDTSLDNAAYWNNTSGVTVAGGVATWASAASGSRLASTSLALVQNKKYRIQFEITSISAGALRFADFGGNALSADISSAGTHTVIIDAVISGSLSLRAAGTTTATVTSYSVQEVTAWTGGQYYLDFDGVDDWLVTPTITPGIDKVQVFIGARKLSDASVNMITELGNNQTNAFSIGNYNSGGGTGPYYNFWSRGSIKASGFAWSGTYSAPITNIITGLGDISGDSSTLRVDGTQIAQVNEDQGTGNYLAYPLYIGTRGSGSLLFNGHIYSMVVRFGDNLITQKITDAETYLAAKSGVTLP